MTMHHLWRILRRVFLFGLLAVVGGFFVVLRAVDVDPRALLRRAQTRLSSSGELNVVREPPAPRSLANRGSKAALPRFDARSTKNWQIDLRGYDVSALDLKSRLDDLRHADFDTNTRWPATLPAGFEPAAILTHNRNPGLGVRALHEKGVTGRGVGIGIIDQALLVNHAEYRARLRCYEELHLFDDNAQMHGPAVASIAVGRTVGVAPGADLYYLAISHASYDSGKYEADFTWLAKAIDRMLAINATLPAHARLRVLSISSGWSPQDKGYDETMAAVTRATQANIFVVSTALSATHQVAFHGLGRDQLADPDRAESYRPGRWWAEQYWNGQRRFSPGERLLVPMDSRTTASPTGADDYVYYSDGGWSWCVPWISGLYALACQVRPDVTPELFWSAALSTGRTIRIQRGDREVDLGRIADPAALLALLQRGARTAPDRP